MKPRTPQAPARPAEAEILPAVRDARWFFYATAAITGGAIMIVEILGAKMLSPYLGTSHFVWTAQIAVTLVALACGYYAGGRLADGSRGHVSRLYWCILAAAVWLCFTVPLCEPVAFWCLRFNLALGTLLASVLLYFVPLALLATTGPFLVRFITSSLAAVGTSVGRLSSISTLGSLAGTLLIGYFLIPLLPNSWTMLLTAAVLAGVAIAHFAFFRRAALFPALGLTLLGGLPALQLAAAPAHSYEFVRETFSANSHFGNLRVVETRAGTRYFLNDNLVQNTYDPARKQSASMFTFMLSGMARAFQTNLHDVLCIGLGVGIVPMELARDGARVDVVEINPTVVEVGRRFFDLEPDKLRLTIGDGRHFLNQAERGKYDAVVLDAFLGDSSPTHLFTREAFASIRAVLKPGGILAINSFGSLEPGRDYFTASLQKTLKAAFPHVRLFTSGDGGFFFAASDKPLDQFVRPPDFAAMHPLVRADAQTAFSSSVQTNPESGRVLTDDFNPAEYYDASNREEFRRRMAELAQRMWL